MTHIPRLARMSSLRRSLILFCSVMCLLVAFNIPTAHAGATEWICKDYHAQGIPSHPWWYRSCVRLVHDPLTHSWRAEGSITPHASGMAVRVNSLRLYNQTTGGT
jgi:hypothetical protein